MASAPNLVNLSEQIQHSGSSREKAQVFKKGLFRVVNETLQHDKEVCNAKWQVNFDVTLDYISHLISECPSLFVAGLHGNGDDTPALSQATSSDAEAIQCYSLTCWIIRHLLQILTRTVEGAIGTKTRELLPSILRLFRARDPVTFRFLTSELIISMGDLSLILANFDVNGSDSCKVEVKRFLLPKLETLEGESGTSSQLPHRPIIVIDTDSCESLQANICEILTSMVLDIAQLNLDRRCYGDGHPPDLMWAAVGCQLEYGSVHLKKVSLDLATQLLEHCGLPEAQVRDYVLSCVTELTNMLCAGFDSVPGDYEGLEANLGKCLSAFATALDEPMHQINKAQLIEDLLSGLIHPTMEHGLHLLKTEGLQQAICDTLAVLYSKGPEYVPQSLVLIDARRELARSLIEVIGERRPVKHVVGCLKQIILLELQETSGGNPIKLDEADVSPNIIGEAMDASISGKERSSTREEDPRAEDLTRPPSTLNHVLKKLTALSDAAGKAASGTEDNDKLVTVLEGMQTLLELLAQCMMAIPQPTNSNSLKGVKPLMRKPSVNDPLSTWLDDKCVEDLCLVWKICLQALASSLTAPQPKDGSSTNKESEPDQPRTIPTAYRAIVRSIGAMVTLKDIGCYSAGVYQTLVFLLSLHWMPNEMLWQDLKPQDCQEGAKMACALAERLDPDTLAEAVQILGLLPKESAPKWRIHVTTAALGSSLATLRRAAVRSFPVLLHHCGPNANHLVYDILHPMLEDGDPSVLEEVAAILGPLACVVSRKAILSRHHADYNGTLVSFSMVQIKCISCDSLTAQELSEGSLDRPKIVDPNMFQPFLRLLDNPNHAIKLKVVSSLRCLFGHISVRSNNAATVSMMETCLKLLKVPDYNVRMAFSQVIGCFIGDESSTRASKTDEILISTLKATTSSAKKAGNVAVVETVLITIGQLGRIAKGDLFFVVIMSLLSAICSPFCPLTSAVAKTQFRQLAAHKKLETKQLFMQFARSICKMLAEQLHEAQRWKRCDPLDIVDEVAELFDFESAKAFLRHKERYILPHLVRKATPHASVLIRSIAKVLGDPNHKGPLARNIDYIFSHLVTSTQGEDLLHTFSFLEGESEWDLATLLRYGQHVDSELLLHLSTNYLEVLQGIKILHTKLRHFDHNTRDISDSMVAELLEPKLLGILVHFDNHLNNGTIPLQEKKQVFESIILLMKLMGPKHLTTVRVRLMTTLKIGMKFHDEGFPELCCRAWNCFVRSIEVVSLGPMLALIVVSLQCLLDQLPKQVANIFNFLIVENRSVLSAHFHELYFMPEIPELADVNAVLQKYVYSQESGPNLEQQIILLLKGICHESQDVRVIALTKLRQLLHSNQHHLHKLILNKETADPIISQMVNALLSGCRESDQKVRILYGECLGELCAIDPTRLELMSSGSKDELTKFPSSVTDENFAVDLINTLCKAFLRADDRNRQDCVGFSIQELIQVYGISPSDPPSSTGGRIWCRFPEEVQELMEPLTRSRYMLTMSYDWSSLTKPIYRSRKGNKFEVWVCTLTGYLSSKVKQEKARKVFDACRGVVKNDSHLALYLLPMVIVQVLLDGTQTDHEEIRAEILEVLNHIKQKETRHGSTSDLRHMSTQTIFSVLDHLTKWNRHRMMVLTAKSMGTSGRSRNTSVSTEKTYAEDKAYLCTRGFFEQIPQDLLASASYNCGAYTRALMHIEQFIKPNTDMLHEHLDFLQKLYVALDETDGVTGITAIKQSQPTLSEQILAFESIGQLSDASVCYDQAIQLEPGELSYRQGLLRCHLDLGELHLAMDLANGMIADRPGWGGNLNCYRVEAAWKLGQWEKLANCLKSESQSHSWNVGLGKVLYAAKTRNETEFTQHLRRIRDDLMTPLSAASMEVGSYHRGYEHIVSLHMLNELEQGLRCMLDFPMRPASPSSQQQEPVSCELLHQQWESRLQFTQSSFRTQAPILNLRRTLLNLGHEEKSLNLTKQIGQCWLHTAKVARECGLVQTAHGALLSASYYNQPGICIEKAKWLWDRGDYDQAISCLEKAIEEYYPDRTKLKFDGADERLACAKVFLLLSQYREETASLESNAIVRQYKEVLKVHSEWEDGYFYIAKYYDKIMTTLIPSDRPEKKGDFLQQLVTFFGQSLTYGNQYIYQSMPRMLTLWLDFGSEVVECEKKVNEVMLQGLRSMLNQLNKLMSNYCAKLAPYQFLTAFPQLTSRICHAHDGVFSQLREMIAKLIVVFPQQTMWMMMAVSKSSYQIRVRRCQEIFNSARLLKKELNKFLQDATKLTDRLLDLCNRPCDATVSNLRISQHFKPLQRLIGDRHFSPILLPLQSLMTVTLPSNTEVSSNHDPFPGNQVYIKGIEDTVEVLPSLQRPKKITLQGSDGKLYIMLCKPKDDLRKDARLMEFNAIINKCLRKNFEARRRDLHIRTYTVTPLNEECGMLEWVSNTGGLRHILMKLYKERGLYTTGQELRTMALPVSAPLQKKLDMYRQKLLPRHPAIFSEWFLKTFPDPTSWYNARLSYARTTAVMSMVGYILGLGDRHGENILLDSTNGDIVHVDFNCLFNKGETFDYPEIVPFRLTHNMVEAMGPTRFEGVFRRACEVTLHVMRDQSDPLVSVLRTFVYDPLVEWSKPVKGRSNLTESGEIKNEKAFTHVSNIESRLRGVMKTKTKPRGLPLSVEGHVNHLIKEATGENNLCQMYIGWAPYL